MTEAEPSVRPPQQQRSRASLERVLDAGTRLLEEKGYEGFTLAEVSRRAKVSIGSIYARVPSKDDLFYAIHQRFMAKLIEEQELSLGPEHWDGVATHELVDVLIRDFADAMRRHAPLLRVIMHRGAVDDVIAVRGSAASTEVGEEFKAVLLTRRAAIHHPDPELAVDVAWRMAYCTLARQVMYGPTFESGYAVEWDELVAELAKACTAYLFGPAD